MKGKTMEQTTMLGKWDEWYRALTPNDMGAFRYSDTVTYPLGGGFLADMEEVEDWGCGAAGFKRFCLGKYTGVDGSHTPFADKIVDLTNYTSRTQGIMMRHVLEHNYEWSKVLTNAVNSFESKFCLVLFTPLGSETKEIGHNLIHGVDVPDISFNRKDLEEHFAGCEWTFMENIATDTGYGVEHVYFIKK